MDQSLITRARFRPQQILPVTALRRRRQFGHENFNWQNRQEWWPVGWKINQIGIARRFRQLHYLACHAPDPVRRRWHWAYQRFCQQHLALHGARVSVRYVNNWTAHSWL